jgi:hypothetical protein
VKACGESSLTLEDLILDSCEWLDCSVDCALNRELEAAAAQYGAYGTFADVAEAALVLKELWDVTEPDSPDDQKARLVLAARLMRALKQPPSQCAVPLVDGSVRSFLSAPEWARVQQAARRFCPGLRAGPEARVDTGLLKEYVAEAFVSGLQEIEGWLDFAGAAEDLDLLEEDIWNGGTQMTQGARAKLISSLRWRLKDFLEQARRVRTFWASAVSEADLSAQDFMACASAVSSANPQRYVWEVCDPLEADIHAFVHRAAGGGSGSFSHEAAGNFVLVVEAVEECMRQAREMQDTLGKWAEESLTLGRPPACRKGPLCADVCWKAQEVGHTATEAWATASAEPLPAKVSPSPCRGN